MRETIRSFACVLLASSLLLLISCTSSEKTGTPDTTMSPSLSPTVTPVITSSPSSTSTPAPTASKSPKPTTENDDVTAALLKQLMTLAKQGKIPYSNYAADTNLIDEVEKDWGKADNTESAGKGIYATYNKQKVTFGFNKGSQIFDVRSYDPVLQQLTLGQIKGTLGEPIDTKLEGNDTIYIYQANDKFELKFIIPKSTGKVDHISVFYPQGSINNMAG